MIKTAIKRIFSDAPKYILMRCGHVASTVDSNNNPVCATCYGLTRNAEIVVLSPDLTKRKARCSYCLQPTDSAIELSHFEYRPNKSFDLYYCGCK